MSSTHMEGLQLQNSEVREAFRLLIQYRNLYAEHCFCFFIDGLDEYEETRQEDYKAMVDLLCGWTEVAPEDVKLCVSSREYNVFQNSLSAGKRLRLQDLTSADMERYIRSKLGCPHDEVTSHLVKSILTRASGIFLWVALVVKSLRERLEETHDISILEKELDTLPDELEDLFRYLLNAATKSARSRAYKTFAMLEALRSTFPESHLQESPDISLFAYSLLEDYAKNPEFAVQTSFHLAGMNLDAKRSRIDQARKILMGSTRGLVEAINGTLKYTHRSIPEFLEGKEIRDEMARHLQNFEAADAVSQLLVAELRVEAELSGTLDQCRCSWLVSCLVCMRAKFGLDREPYSFLESLESLLIEHWIHDKKLIPKMGIVTDAIVSTAAQPELFTSPAFTIRHRGPEPETTHRFYIISPFHISAALGMEEYVSWKILHDKNILDRDFETAILVTIVGNNLTFFARSGVQILEALFERGLSPQSLMGFPVTPHEIRIDNDRTVWEDFVLLFALWLYEEPAQDQLGLVGKAFEKFLKSGADTSLWFSVCDSDKVILEMRARDGRKMRAERLFGRIKGQHPLFTKVGGISFRELVEYSDFDNKESLLELVDHSNKQQDGRTGVGRVQGGHSMRLSADSISTERSSTKPGETGSWQLHTWLRSINASHAMTFGLGRSRFPCYQVAKHLLIRT